MADTGEVKPDAEATKWFVLAIIGTVLYVGAAFGFVILADVEPGTDAVLVDDAEPAGEAEHGR
jgi:hypothetical protein